MPFEHLTMLPIRLLLIMSPQSPQLHTAVLAAHHTHATHRMATAPCNNHVGQIASTTEGETSLKYRKSVPMTCDALRKVVGLLGCVSATLLLLRQWCNSPMNPVSEHCRQRAVIFERLPNLHTLC